MSNSYYITTPIYYVNDAPHIGHAYTTIAADTLARYYRSSGRNTRFMTGTDEHGIKMVQAAETKNVTPRQLADKNVVFFKELWKEMKIENDAFIRTSEPMHENRVKNIINTLLEKDEIYLGQYEGWYDEGQEEYVSETDARENEFKSPINGKPLTKYSEENWFFRLEKWVPRLVEHIENNPGFIKPKERRNEVISKLKLGVKDLCISRNKEKLPWGVEMPNDPNHVVYVWVDALSNYYTGCGLPEIGDEFDGQASQYWPADVHLIGKDILWFHAVYWPCILMALDVPLPKTVFAHGWWTSNGQKMSKSLGNYISKEVIQELCNDYSRDVFKYYLLRAVGFGSDGDFSHDNFKTIYNSDLANGIGNLLSRSTNMISKYFDGKLPEINTTIEEAADVISAAEELQKSSDLIMEDCAFHKYIDKVTNLINKANRFIEVTEPFKLAKDETQKDRLAAILYTCAESTRVALTYLQPIMPEKCAVGLDILGGQKGGLLSEAGKWGGLKPGDTIAKAEPLFPRKK